MNYQEALNAEKDSKKFDENCEPLPFAGNTIISLMNSREYRAYSLAEDIQKQFQRAGFSKKLAFLPSDSIHMTVIPLLNETARYTELWPDYIDDEADFEEVDQILVEKYEKVPRFDQVKMKVTEITPTSIYLTPADEGSKKELEEYREEIAKVTAVKHNNHEEYQFHISIAYVCTDFSKEDFIEGKEMCELLNKRIMEEKLNLTVPSPEFTVFNSMVAYSSDLRHRNNKN